MAMFVYTIFFGITTAFCVPYLYAYCTQTSNVTISPESEKKDENIEDENIDDLVHSIRVKEQGSSLIERKKSRKIMKDPTVNTIDTMSGDTTSYIKIPSFKENSQEESNAVDDSSVVTRNPRKIQVEAQVHAQNMLNSETFIKETAEKRTGAQSDCQNINNNHLPKKKQYFKKANTSGKFRHTYNFLKRSFLTGLRSRGLSSRKSSKLSCSDNSSQTTYPPSSGTSGSSFPQGTKSNTGTSQDDCISTFKSQSPIGHSTLLESQKKLVVIFHEVNGKHPIQIESSSGSNSLIISGGDSTTAKRSQSENTNFRMEVLQSRVESSDQETIVNEKF